MMGNWIGLFWRLMATFFLIMAVVSKHYGASWDELNNLMLWVVSCLLFVVIEEKN
jgi:hypothetical protein